MDIREYWYWLLNIANITVSEMDKLIEFFGNPYEIFRANIIPDIITSLQKEAIFESKLHFDKLRRDYHELDKKGIKMVLRGDEEFPEKFYGINEDPYGFFLRGHMPSKVNPIASIIGSRRASSHGKWFASRISEDLAKMGFQIVSGMAEGIDGSAHIGALEGGGETFAVLGSGIDVCFPATHNNLYKNIINNGGVISEYGLGIPGLSFHFPKRNRLISALSDIVIVIEAREKSGSLITVGNALMQGREVMAVPGRPDDPYSEGCNRLIREGAGCCTCAQDVIDELNILRPHVKTPYTYSSFQKSTSKDPLRESGAAINTSINIASASSALSDDESRLLEFISGEPIHIEEIFKLSGLPFQRISTLLSGLELRGIITAVSPGLYRRK